MRYLFVLFLPLLSGCWFVYIPANVFSSPNAGNACIQDGFFVGDKIKSLDTGKVGTVQKVYGKSSRCGAPSHPNLADVAFE